jgi:hypothetical protein
MWPQCDDFIHVGTMRPYSDNFFRLCPYCAADDWGQSLFQWGGGWYDSGTIATHRSMQADTFHCILVKLCRRRQISAYRKTWRLFACAKLMTNYSPFLCIKPSQHLVISVCPIYNCLYPHSYVTSLSLIIFKIIPHPMTLLTAFPLQVIILYLFLYRLFSLAYCHITYLLSRSHIPSHRVHLTHFLNLFS